MTHEKMTFVEIENRNKDLEIENERLKNQILSINQAFINSATDFTIIKNLQVNQLNIAFLFQNHTEAIILVDMDFRIYTWNKGAENLYGWKPEEVIGRNGRELLKGKIQEPEELARHTMLKNGFWKGEVEYQCKNGKQIIVLAFASLLKDEKDNPIGMVTLNYDITERKLAENEVIKAKEKSEESDRLKTTFLQNMSHEIRSPMNAIMGFAELLPKQFNNKIKLEKFSQIINQRCKDLLEMINDILDIAKIESAQLSVNIEECNLSNLFTELTSFFKEHQKRIDKQQIKFSIHSLCDPLEIILIDKVKLKQIFINLIVNAFKFTDKGNIEGGCKFDVDHNLIFYVSDTGIGIPPEKYDAIFERFIQLRQGIKRANGGTGLGLSIVKGLIGLLGGKIWIESKLEKGTVFYFSIPYIITQSLLREPIPEEPHEYYFPNKTVLVVEDDLSSAEYIKEILSCTGLNIMQTEYGNEAVQIAASQTLDLVLMDIRLPDMDGYEAIRHIKRHKPDLRIIVQTAYAAHGDKQKAIDAGCIDYISKPLEQNLLLSMLNKCLS
jgi:PAS domain S-box-containing protein